MTSIDLRLRRRTREALHWGALCLALAACSCSCSCQPRPATDTEHLWESCFDGDSAACMTLGKRNLGLPREQQQKSPASCFQLACDYGVREACLLMWPEALETGMDDWLLKTLGSDDTLCRSGDVQACREQRQHMMQATEKPVHDKRFAPLMVSVIASALRSEDEDRELVATSVARGACTVDSRFCMASARELLAGPPLPASSARQTAATEVWSRVCGPAGPLRGYDEHGTWGDQRDLCNGALLGIADTLGEAQDEVLSPLWALTCDHGSALACGKHAQWLWRDTSRDSQGWRALHRACLGGSLPALPDLVQAFGTIAAGTPVDDSVLQTLPDGCLWLLEQVVYARHGHDFARWELQQLFQRHSWYRPSSGPSTPTPREQLLLQRLRKAQRPSLLEGDLATALARGGIFVDAPRCFRLRDSVGLQAWKDAGNVGTALCANAMAHGSSPPRRVRVPIAIAGEHGVLEATMRSLSEVNLCLLVPGDVPLPTPTTGSALKPSAGGRMASSMRERALANVRQQVESLQAASPTARHLPCDQINLASADYDNDGDVELVVELRCGGADCQESKKPCVGSLGGYSYGKWAEGRSPDESYRFYCDPSAGGGMPCHVLGSYEAGPDCANAHLPPGSSTEVPSSGSLVPAPSSSHGNRRPDTPARMPPD